jgi:hypothetical protein
MTFVALGPFGPCSVLYVTRCPSARDLNPLDWIAVWWTNTSGLPSAGVMNPKPLPSLNHFTVPVAMIAAYICQRCREVQIVAEEVRESALIGAGSEELPELLRENLRRRVAYTNAQQKDTRA